LFIFSQTPTISFYTLSLHDALPICFERDTFDVDVVINSYNHDDVDDLISEVENIVIDPDPFENKIVRLEQNDVRILNIDVGEIQDRKSTRLNSSHVSISYAVFCLKK